MPDKGVPSGREMRFSMIRRLRTWWRRTGEHRREKRELLIAADKILRKIDRGVLTDREIELYLVNLGVLHLEAVSESRDRKVFLEAGPREGLIGALPPILH